MKLCRLYRLIISSRLSDGATLPRFVTQHCQQCVACRQVLASWQTMETSLRQSVKAEQVAPSPWLATRIMQNLDTPEVKAAPAFSFSRLAILGSLAALAALLVVQSNQPPAENISVARSKPTTTSTLVPPSLTTVVDTARIKELAVSWEQPLEVELKSVMADAKLALNGLAYNFLPDGYQQP